LVQLSVTGTEKQMAAVTRDLTAANPNLEVRPIRQIAAAEGQLLARIRLLILLMVLLILVLTVMCLLATMAALAIERRADVGLMKALGGSISRIVAIFLAEAGLLGATGGIVGYALGIGLTFWMGRRVFHASVSPRWEVFPLHRSGYGGRLSRRRLSAAMAGKSETGRDPAGRMMPPAVQVEGLTKQFGNVRALDGVSFEVAAGEWVAIMGPSGSGKTTLVNILGGLDSPSGGRVWVGGAEMSQLDESGLTRFRAEKVGFIFQQFHMVPYLTAVENVMLAQYFHSMTDEKEARRALQRVGLGDRLDHRPSQLSGGEQQRVAVARALINHPTLILADEPTGNLDETNEEIVIQLFHELHSEGHTIVMVTHDPSMGRRADRRIQLAHGRLVQITGPVRKMKRTSIICWNKFGSAGNEICLPSFEALRTAGIGDPLRLATRLVPAVR
jgi:putative ABC transport system ATP-binding protein